MTEHPAAPTTPSGQAILDVIGEALGYPVAGTPAWNSRVADIETEARAAALPSVDELAQIIRRVDGEHSLGAGALAVREGQNHYGIGAHPLALVLSALDGEDDPTQLGLSDDTHDAFMARLSGPVGECARFRHDEHCDH